MLFLRQEEDEDSVAGGRNQIENREDGRGEDSEDSEYEDWGDEDYTTNEGDQYPLVGVGVPLDVLHNLSMTQHELGNEELELDDRTVLSTSNQRSVQLIYLYRQKEESICIHCKGRDLLLKEPVQPELFLPDCAVITRQEFTILGDHGGLKDLVGPQPDYTEGSLNRRDVLKGLYDDVDGAA
ncbi:449adb89-9125-477f-80d7-ca2dfe7b55dc [Sclerotinia trifoliorum]|uniref:449adb89-9125-477f-80d7-ca2dfe7b55dc n=1 Tax=Sclerotinia trifoliorum TaxID=28548 RepID=A0A8H2VMW6_9HELO|nr:449adb89-9125-477f-80d7-ca2dfe7b55dc [Sclerotinia trifoliorum]